MLRLRRYRVFVVFAVVALGLFYHFKGIGYAQSSIAASVSSLKYSTGHVKPPEKAEDPLSSDNSNDRFNALNISPVPSPSSLSPDLQGATSTRAFDTAEDAFEQLNHGLQQSQSLTAASKPLKSPLPSRPFGSVDENHHATVDDAATSSNAERTAKYQRPPKETSHAKGHASKGDSEEQEDEEGDLSDASTLPRIHWSPMSEHFPIPTKSLIPIPVGDAKLPKIQHDFGSTSGAGKVIEQDKLDVIKESFQFSWSGYKEKAWMQDELSPKTGKARNPFCGWGATLVDSLDTLWLMDLKDEFEDAVDAVKDIDFTTSSRNDIPLFETVIRYLGGLIGAYDISGGRYEVLLTKAIELAEVLMGAFDTPNRMPMTFYLWKPTFASQPHRAKTRVVMAELGSLSLEFTRLAQLTQQTKYYDAIARITNEFAIWQNNTQVPGLWPLKVDASGCKKPDPGATPSDVHGDKWPTHDINATKVDHAISHGDSTGNRGPKNRRPASTSLTKVPQKEISQDLSKSSTNLTDQNDDLAAYNPRGHIEKRDSSTGQDREKVASNSTDARCEVQGLASPPYSTTEEFSLGGLADSTYEYLPKEYVLLNGLEPKYRSMYELAAEAAKKHLIYRPMIPDANRSILHAGLLRSTVQHASDISSQLQAEGTHLTCFAGGMFALGSKVFDREQDMEIASKLTDGCIWAYEATKTGIMPETYSTIPCKRSESCAWNETLWLAELDPYGAWQTTAKTDYTQQRVLSEDGSRKNGSDKGVVTAHIGSTIEDGATPIKAPKAELGSTPQEAMEITSHDEATYTSDSKDDESQENNPSVTEASSRAKEATTAHTVSTSKSSSPHVKRQLGEVDGNAISVNGDVPSKAPRIGDSSNVEVTSDSALQLLPTHKTQEDRDADNSELKSLTVTDGLPSVSSDETVPLASSVASQEPTKTIINNQVDSRLKLTALNKTTSPFEVSTGASPSGTEASQPDLSAEKPPRGMTRISPRYLLRPEAIESVFIMYRITGDQYWRTKGWQMFQAIEKHTKSTYGASAISDVNQENSKQLDEMESFWLAETLKYFYLLFSDPDTMSLDDYVLNTEAHPFKRPKKS